MIEWFRSGGFLMWPVAVAAILVVVSGVRSWLGLRSADAAPEVVRGHAEGVLFWGGIAAAAGVLGTLGGVAQLARAIGAAGHVSPALLWSGLSVTLVTSIAGLTVLLVALLAWYGLRARVGRYV